MESADTMSTKEGKHASVAQSVLAKLLYCGRLARPDIVIAINLLSRCLTRWTVWHDGALLTLVAYCHNTAGLMLHGYMVQVMLAS